MGAHRTRRRRSVFIAAALVLTAGGVTGCGPRQQTSEPQAIPADWAWPADAMVWAVGSTIHADGYSLDVGPGFGPFVRTAKGFVFIDASQPPKQVDFSLPAVATVYSVTDAGVVAIGEAAADGMASQGALRSDPQGTLVGWVGRDSDFEVYDQATAVLRSFPTGAAWPNRVEFNAIDGRTAYATVSNYPEQQSWALDVDTGEFHPLSSVQGPLVDVYSAHSGVLVYGILTLEREQLSLHVGRSTDDGLELVEFNPAGVIPATNYGSVSPNGDWFALGTQTVTDGQFSASTADFVDTRTGQRRPFDVPDAGSSYPVAWLDDTTAQVLRITEGTPFSYALFRCTVTDGSCDGEVDLEIPDNLFPIMPTGLLLW